MKYQIYLFFYNLELNQDKIRNKFLVTNICVTNTTIMRTFIFFMLTYF
jgi:hypothetical protein